MNSAQARTLLALHDAGPQRVTDLARLDHLKQPSMSVVLIRMERLGWVRRLEITTTSAPSERHGIELDFEISAPPEDHAGATSGIHQ
jgi:hypothetical protein